MTQSGNFWIHPRIAIWKCNGCCRNFRRLREETFIANHSSSRCSSSSSFSLFLMPFQAKEFLFTYGSFRHLVGLLGWGISPAPRPLPTHRTTQHRETQTHINAPRRIRTCDPNVRAAEDWTCLRPRGYWDRPRCSCIAILWVSLVSSAAIILCATSQQVIIVVVVYFVIDRVRKLLDTHSD
jgi:hypothetical protein